MALLETKLTGLKKRQQIESASRTMFIWVAIASVAISVCVVTSQSFFQRIIYNSRVIAAKQKADDTLAANITNATQLKQKVDGLVGNQDLASVKLNPSDPNTKSVLDALPSAPDTTELATSLQQAILNHSGVSIESISVNQSPTTTTAATTSTTSASLPIEEGFSIVIDGSYSQIRSTLLDMERTIRPIKIVQLDLSGEDVSMRATINGVTYYQPAKTAKVGEELIK